MQASSLNDLIVANHILHYHNVVDAYGHISLRHPDKPDIFIMPASKAPALVSSPSDFVQYRISDADPVDPAAKEGYQERFIHSEIYKTFPYINSVVHSHSEQCTQVPIHDVVPLYKNTDAQDLLINCSAYGASLVSTFLASPSSNSIHTKTSGPHHKVVLMANHGFTAIGATIKQAVFRAVYTHQNAKVQSEALKIRAAHLATSGGPWCEALGERTLERPWELWVREVEAAPLYVNKLKGLDLTHQIAI
ncbi:class II aldolase and Adducin N-terminal domain-containing protein [Bisporella sp. PMI_857]|nr:class II aldolase and Adducin N-terminal domain-containing protein [Bisporella sp. PMI_857]